MAFNEAQLQNLEAKLDAKHVRTRRVHDTTLAYVEGWHVIAIRMPRLQPRHERLGQRVAAIHPESIGGPTDTFDRMVE